MNPLIRQFNRLQKRPFGSWLFSWAIGRRAPYFRSIRPRVEALREGYGRVWMKNRRSVHNHLGTVHAIASCNLAEITAGLTIEASLPRHLRWIPIKMEVEYLKKATTDLYAICEIDPVDWEQTPVLPLLVSIRNQDEAEVVRATISMKISAKKNKKA
ncbi:MAG: hotdog fold domain-containing protein [Bacteroidota bacterium]